MIVVKALVSGSIIVAVNALALRSPRWGGWIAAMPLISLLSVIWLRVDGKTNPQLAEFLVGVLAGLIPTALYLGVAVFALRLGASLLLALGLGVASWLALTLVVQALGFVR